MKGRYSGCRMTVYGAILPGAASIARWASKIESLTPEARRRIKIMDWHRAHGNNVSLTARHFGMTRYTVREWSKRFRRYGILGLNEQSRKPKNFRKPATPWNTIIRIIQLRKQYPAWSKYKIKALLKREGIQVSESTVGRVLKRRGLIDKKVSQKHRKAALRPKARFPRGLRISQPGDLIQMDTKCIMLPGVESFINSLPLMS